MHFQPSIEQDPWSHKHEVPWQCALPCPRKHPVRKQCPTVAFGSQPTWDVFRARVDVIVVVSVDVVVVVGVGMQCHPSTEQLPGSHLHSSTFTHEAVPWSSQQPISKHSPTCAFSMHWGSGVVVVGVQELTGAFNFGCGSPVNMRLWIFQAPAFLTNTNCSLTGNGGWPRGV